MKSKALPPHPVLDAHYTDPEDRQEYVDYLFDDSAHHYDRVNRLMSFGTGTWYRGQALRRAGLAEGHAMLDVACGTGVIAHLASKIVGPEGSAIGVDPSAGMRRQAEQRGVRVLEGHAEGLPVDDASVDFLSMGYGLRHVTDLRAAFAEFHRVLRPGGRLLILEISRPRSTAARGMLSLYLGRILPLVTLITTGNRHARQMMRYYWDSIDQCVDAEVILDALRDEQFLDVERHVEQGIFSEYVVRRDG